MLIEIEVGMDDRRRKQAEIFAVLANRAVLSEMKRWQRIKLIEDARENRTVGGLSVANLSEVHRWTYKLINERLDAGKVNVSEFCKKMARPVSVEGDNKSTAIRWDFRGTDDIKWVFWDLWNVITLHPFPFRRCLVCKTIFVVAGKRKYCSQKCAARALGSRNDYMREYMRKKRKNAKRKAKEQTK